MSNKRIIQILSLVFIMYHLTQFSAMENHDWFFIFHVVLAIVWTGIFVTWSSR